MSIEALTKLDQAAVTARTRQYPLILLPPHRRDRHALLAWFVQKASNPYFYAVRAEDRGLAIFLKNLVEAIREIDPAFGHQTLQALMRSRVKPADLAAALLDDLRQAAPEPHYVVLDEVDRLPLTQEVETFLTCWIAHLPVDMQVVINSRQLPDHPWLSLVRSGQAVLLGEPPARDEEIIAGAEQSHLEVYGFGVGRVFVDGVPVDAWEGPLVQRLCYYLIDHPMVTRAEIFEAFWPHLTPRDATNVFHVTKRKISELLGSEVTTYAGGFYYPSGQLHVQYDVRCFEEAIHQARHAQPETALDRWLEAIRLYRLPFLQHMKVPWISARRAALKQMYAEALLEAGRAYHARHDTARAVSYLLRASREVPEREDIHRDLMTLYAARGEREKVMAQYAALCATLQRTLQIGPSKTTQKLYVRLGGDNPGETTS
jgi:DNA-binding SARP family transcriptional activator